MRNVLTIVRRELAQNFRAPLAYVFLILFVVLVQLPFMLTVFAVGRADLRVFFDVLPWFAVVFAALVTMRSWAEDRSANTYEMLLTFPMKEWELVLGKWLGSFLFLVVALLSTLALPALLFANGHPDLGPMLSGYLGAILLMATWSAIGACMSSLTSSQLLAALVTFVLAFLSLAFGIEQVRMLVEAQAPLTGRLLGSMFGSWAHYAPFSRGVIDLADVLFFAVWTVVFLWLNTLALQRGRRSVSRGATILATVLTLGCGVLGGRLTFETSLARADMTEQRIYTLSEGTINILRRAKAPVRATLYITARDEMPSDYQALEQEVMDRLSELRAATGGMLAVRVMHPQAANLVLEPEDQQADKEKDKAEGEETETRRREKSIEQRLREKGVQPFEAQTVEATQASTKVIFATLGLAYAEKDEEFIQPLNSQNLGELEYKIANTVARLVRPRAPKIALVLGEEPMDPFLRQQYMQQGVPLPDPYSQIEQLLRQEKFDVERVKLSGHEPLPADYDALIVIGPSDLNDRQRYEIDRALVSGKPALLALQRYTWDYPDSKSGGIELKQKTTEPGLDAFLDAQGLGISRNILMDNRNQPLSMRTGDLRDLMGGKRVPSPMHLDVQKDSLAADSVLTERLSSLFMPWATAIEIDRDKLSKSGLDVKVLVKSGPESWQVDKLRRQSDLTFAGVPGDENRAPLLVRVDGEFVDVYAGRERPKWPFSMDRAPDGRPLPMPADTPESELVKKPATLYLCSCARMWANGFANAFDNSELLLNLVDAMTLDTDLLTVRSRSSDDRRLEKPSLAKAALWQVLPHVAAPLLILLVGLLIGVGRMRARESWNSKHGR